MREPRFYSGRNLPPPGDDLWQWAISEHPILHGLTSEEQRQLRELSQRLLRHRQIITLGEVEATPELRLSIAVQATLPVLKLGLSWYRGWGSLYLSAEEYQYEDLEVDAAGVVHEISETVSGQALPLGSVVLSVADVEASGWGDGYNVVIHEMAHIIDRQNGRIDGAPPLPRDMDSGEWAKVFTSAYENLQERVSRPRGRGKRYRGAVDPYAAEAPEEFFAVACELFFESPKELIGEYPEVYRLLRRFFRQDPAARL